MKIIKLTLVLSFTTTFLVAQSSLEALNMTIQTLGKLGMGTSSAEFMKQKPNLPGPDFTMGFRGKTIETVGKDGLETVTYYFDDEGSQPLYEMILEFSSAEIRSAVVGGLFGKPNHPSKSDYWILKADGASVTLGWPFEKKFIIASNISGSEWTGNAMFTLPSDFTLKQKNLTNPATWTKPEIAQFFNELQLQIDAGADGFEKIKGEEQGVFFISKQGMEKAQLSAVFPGDASGRLLINNSMSPELPIETAVDWKYELEKLLTDAEMSRYRLVRVESKMIFEKIGAVWNVTDKMDKPTGIQVGLVVFGENMRTVFLVVMLA